MLLGALRLVRRIVASSHEASGMAAYISVPPVHGDASLGCRDDALARLVPPSHARTVVATNTHSKLQDTQCASWGEMGFLGLRGHGT